MNASVGTTWMAMGRAALLGSVLLQEAPESGPLALVAATVVFVPLFLATLLALFVTVALLLPGWHTRARLKIEGAPVRILLLGFVNLLFWGVLFLVLSQIDVVNLVALLIGLAALAVTVVGSTAIAQLLGDRLGVGQTPIARLVLGGLLLLLACLTPIVGWFVVTPLFLIAGLGAGVMGLVRRRRVSAPVEGVES